MSKNHSYPGVYAIVNTVADHGRRYIGSSVNIHRRWGEHLRALQEGTHYCPYLQRSWNTHSESAFEFQVLERCPNDPSVLIVREQHWLDQFKDCLYNCHTIADTFSTAWHRSDSGRATHVAIGKKVSAYWKTVTNRTFRCIQCGKEFETRDRRRIVKYCSKACVQTAILKSGVLSEERTCVVCGKLFIVESKYMPNQACSHLCGQKRRSKISNDDVREILRRVADKESVDAIGKDYEMTGRTILQIARRETWSDVSISHEIETLLEERFSSKWRFPTSHRKITTDQVREIKRYLKYNVKQKSLAKKFGVSPNLICHIKHGRMYADIEPAPDPSPLLPGFD